VASANAAMTRDDETMMRMGFLLNQHRRAAGTGRQRAADGNIILA